MKCCNAYENSNMSEVMGETLRPGGFALTDKAVQFCNFNIGDTILDLGCGLGATVNYLKESYKINALGIDPSEKLLNIAREKYGYNDFKAGSGEKIPFENEKFEGVFAECTLSLMADLDSVITEVFRILKDKGWFIITDVYAKNPEFTDKLKEHTFNSCMRGLHDLKTLKDKLKLHGFEIEILDDCSHFLKELLVKIVFTYGSMGLFWSKTTDGCIDGCSFEKILTQCKPGYFILIARKGES